MLGSCASSHLRAYTLVLLLTGSLFPDIGGMNLVAPAAVLAVLFVIGAVAASVPRVHPALVVVVPVFGVLIAYGVLVDPVSAYGEEKVARLATLTLLSALAAALIRGFDDLVAVAFAWVVLGAVLAVVVIFGDQAQAGRAVGFEGNNAIGVGRMLATGVVFAVWLQWQRRLPVVSVLALVGAFAAAIWTTGSRGPFLAALLGLLVLAMGARHRARAAGWLLAFGAVLVAAFAFVPAVRASRIGLFLSDPHSDLTARLRLDLWDRTWWVISENPGGVGYGGFGRAARVLPVPYPHNLFLELTAEAGWLVGAGLIGVVAVVMMRLLGRGTEGATLALALLVVETVGVCVSGDLNARPFFLFLTVGYIVARWPGPMGPRIDAARATSGDRGSRPGTSMVRRDE